MVRPRPQKQKKEDTPKFTLGAGKDCRGTNSSPSHNIKVAHRALPREDRPSLREFARTTSQGDNEDLAIIAHDWLRNKGIAA